MLNAWLKAGSDPYGITNGEPWGIERLLEFLGLIGFDGESRLDLHAVLPWIGMEAEWFSPQELFALEYAELVIAEAEDPAAVPVTLRQHPDTEYEVEPILRDGRRDHTVSTLGKILSLAALLHDDEAAPTVYSDRKGLVRIVTPWSLVGIGRMRGWGTRGIAA